MAVKAGPFHSLSESDRTALMVLVSGGRSVRSVAAELGCHYGHALNFCHAQGLPVVYRAGRVDRDSDKAKQLVDLLEGGANVHEASRKTGICITAAYAIAEDAGCHIRLSRFQRKVRQTQRRVEYLRLRLASLSPRDAIEALGLGIRLASDFERGIIRTGKQDHEFIPVGADARTYNRLMTALRQRVDVIEQGRLKVPALPVGVDPYKRISSRYLSFEDRVVIADLLREHASYRTIGKALGRSASSIKREVDRNHSAEGPYRAETAQLKACARRLRPKIPKLLGNKRLMDYVCDGLRAQWSGPDPR